MPETQNEAIRLAVRQAIAAMGGPPVEDWFDGCCLALAQGLFDQIEPEPELLERVRIEYRAIIDGMTP